MMCHRSVVGVCSAVALLVGNLAIARSIQSGPPVGEKVPGPFAPLNITGPAAGQNCCQYCKNGSRPVAVIFAREMSPAVIGLLKRIDSATAANRASGMASYIVFCSDDASLVGPLRDMARKENIQNTVVTLYKAGGPERYRLSAEADVTVLLYSHLTIKANHAFKKSELTEAAIDRIIVDITKLLAE